MVKKVKKPECVIQGCSTYLNWVLVAAFRYSIDRHQTQAMYGIDQVISDNIGIISTGFLKQFVDGIQNEVRINEFAAEWELSRENDIFFGLKGHIKDAQRMVCDVNDEKTQEIYRLLNQLTVLLEDVDQDKIINRENIYKPKRYDLSYLMPLLAKVSSEIEKREGIKYESYINRY